MKTLIALTAPLVLFACQPKHSPKTSAGNPEAEKQPTAATPTPESFVGLTAQAAAEKAEKADLPHRIIKKDGEDLPVTRDYRPERLNFTVDKGIVTQVTGG
jgi:hypothetical protein